MRRYSPGSEHHAASYGSIYGRTVNAGYVPRRADLTLTAGNISSWAPSDGATAPPIIQGTASRMPSFNECDPLMDGREAAGFDGTDDRLIGTFLESQWALGARPSAALVARHTDTANATVLESYVVVSTEWMQMALVASQFYSQFNANAGTDGLSMMASDSGVHLFECHPYSTGRQHFVDGQAFAGVGSDGVGSRVDGAEAIVLGSTSDDARDFEGRVGELAFCTLTTREQNRALRERVYRRYPSIGAIGR